MTAEIAPLVLPETFDPQACMIARVTENGVFHESRAGAGLAARLVANGAPQDLELAEKILNVVLNAQERRAGDPHYGNFLWMIEDDVVFDLNAVEFNLEHLIPMMIRHADRLSPQMRERVMDAIRLGLAEIEKLDVLIAYSNIAVLDILNTCLGGELLRDRRIAEWGYRKMAAWMAFTDQHGIPFEYNSPTYTAVMIRSLKTLADLVKDRDTRIRALTASARIGLSVGLHIHRRTGRWAGPHSRVYHPTVLCETPPEAELVRQWIAEGALPAWVEDVLEAGPQTFEVQETAFSARELGITTFHSPSFVLGTSVKEAGGQSDVAMIHYTRPGVDRPGVFYTRYLTNEKWLGDFYHATDRTKSRNLIEEGNFYGVQQGSSAICLYALPPNQGPLSSAKAALIWTGRDQVDSIWIDNRRVEALPASLVPGETVVIGSGGAWIAVRPLTRTDLGRDAPIRLVEREGDLVLEIYNYLGPSKPFWEMNWPGAFYQGRPQCGFYLEAAERADYPDGASFAREIAAGRLVDQVEPPFTYTGEGERLWRVVYERGDRRLGIEVDLMAWKLKRRWRGNDEAGWPMLESPVARENREGCVRAGGATLTCGNEAGWLFACPEKKRWVAAYHGLQPAPVKLEVPGGSVAVPAMTTGLIVWDNGRVTVEASGIEGTPVVEGGALQPAG